MSEVIEGKGNEGGCRNRNFEAWASPPQLQQTRISVSRDVGKPWESGQPEALGVARKRETLKRAQEAESESPPHS